MKTTRKTSKALLWGASILLLTCTAVSQVAAQPCVLPPSGLVSWWPGDGNANDIVDENPGTLQNGATFAPGKVGQAFKFDGLDDFVRVEHNPNLSLNQMTIGAYISTAKTRDSSFSVFVSKTRPFVALNPPSIFNRDALPYPGLNLGAPHFQFTVGGNARCVQGTQNLIDGRFHHVLATWDGNKQEIYVDGVKVQTVPVPIGYRCTTAIPGDVPDTNTEPLVIGFEPIGRQANFEGLVDEVVAFNRALSAAEIKTIFEAGSAGMCKGVPFSTFAATAVIGLGPLPNDDWFRVSGDFTLSDSSNGIFPPTDTVVVGVGSFSRTLPPGSFSQIGGGGGFKFEGLSDGVALKVVIQPRGGGSFGLRMEGDQANLDGTGLPVVVKLWIHDDRGEIALKKGQLTLLQSP